MLEWFKTVFPSEANALLGLFDNKFEADEVWNALAAIASIGKKAEAFLTHPVAPAVVGSAFHPNVTAVTAAKTITNAELVSHFHEAWEKCNKCPVVTADAAGATPAAPAEAGAVEMNPILAGLIVNLAQRALALILARFGL